MRINSQDETLKRNYIQKYRFLIKYYELVKTKKHSRFKYVKDFYHTSKEFACLAPDRLRFARKDLLFFFRAKAISIKIKISSYLRSIIYISLNLTYFGNLIFKLNSYYNIIHNSKITEQISFFKFILF